MERIINNTDNEIIYVVYAWWLHSLENLKGKVLIVGDFNEQAMEYLSVFCDDLVIIDNPAYYNNKYTFQKAIKINEDAIEKHSFDTIIINNLNESLGLTTELLSKLMNKCLKKDGFICLLDKNECSLKSSVKNVFNSIANLILDCKIRKFKRIHNNSYITKLPTISYDNVPYESFLEGHYSSNKNTFALKEKIRTLILKSRLSRLFVNSNIWLISYNKDTLPLHKSIINFISEQQGLCSEKYVLTRVLYKSGKLILSYSCTDKTKSPIVAILLYENNAISQRTNEKNIIKELTFNKDFSNILPHNYCEYDFHGFKLFCMDECPGVTVDITTNNLQTMTKNAFEKLLTLSSDTLHNHKSLPLVKSWIDILSLRSPASLDSIECISEFLMKYNFDKSVCMHGDSKLENFVMDDKYNIRCIIDWEQAVLDGIPMIDIYYLIAYNYQTSNDCHFSNALDSLISGNIESYENDFLTTYSDALSLTNFDRIYLLVVFFVHHYSCRFHATVDYEYEYIHFNKALLSITNLIKEID